MSLPEISGFDGVNVADDSLVDLEQVLECDLTRRSIDQSLVDVLQGRVQAQDLVVFYDAFAADRQLRL